MGRIGGYGTNLDKRQADRIVSLHNQEVPVTAIAQRFGVTAKTIYTILQKSLPCANILQTRKARKVGKKGGATRKR